MPGELAPAAQRAVAAADGLRARGAGRRRRTRAPARMRLPRARAGLPARRRQSRNPARIRRPRAGAGGSGLAGSRPGRVQRAAVGARALRRAARGWRAGHISGGRDRLRARLHRVGARPEHPGDKCARDDPRAARQSDRGGFSVEQLSDEPWGRRRPRMRRVRRRLRRGHDAFPARALAGQREDAGHLAGRPAGRARLPEPPVRDDRRRRRGAVRRADLHPEHRGRRRLCDRRHALGLDRLHRHERLRALQRARRRGRAVGRLAGAAAWPSAVARSPACSSSAWR